MVVEAAAVGAYALAKSGKAGEVVTTVVVTKAAEGLLRKIQDSTLKNWNGSERKKKEIAALAQQRRVMGSMRSARSTSNDLKRKEYAKSPILKYMQRAFIPGTVYVAFVPSGMGKTTACEAFMDKRYGSNALAFLPTDDEIPYFDSILSLLSIDSENPPEGVLRHLLASLSAGAAGHPGRFPYLILDDFMTNGPHQADVALVNNIKKIIRGTDVIAIVLTGSKLSANFLLSQNNLEYVCPLVKSDKLIEIAKEHRPVSRNKPVPIDWVKYLSMVWEKEELMKALVGGDEYGALDDAQKDDLASKFGPAFDLLSEEDRESTSPREMFKILLGDQAIGQVNTMSSPSNASAAAGAGTNVGASCGCGDQCRIM